MLPSGLLPLLLRLDPIHCQDLVVDIPAGQMHIDLGHARSLGPSGILPELGLGKPLAPDCKTPVPECVGIGVLLTTCKISQPGKDVCHPAHGEPG